jgi:hypothetical protein
MTRRHRHVAGRSELPLSDSFSYKSGGSANIPKSVLLKKIFATKTTKANPDPFRFFFFVIFVSFAVKFRCGSPMRSLWLKNRFFVQLSIKHT